MLKIPACQQNLLLQLTSILYFASNLKVEPGIPKLQDQMCAGTHLSEKNSWLSSHRKKVSTGLWEESGHK